MRLSGSLALLVLVQAACTDASRPTIPVDKVPPFPGDEVQRVAGHQRGDARDLIAKGDPVRGAQLWLAQCATCHGTTGHGDGPEGPITRAKDFAAVGKDAFEPERLYQIIREGGTAIGPAVSMPGYRRRLADEEIADVAAYVQRLVLR